MQLPQHRVVREPFGETVADQQGALVDHEFAGCAAESVGRRLEFVASVCGTAADPQGIERQRTILRDAGVILAATNASAVRFVAAQQAGAHAS